ncbi:unnamed protein product, partial [marine sediment metagenome]
MSKSVRLALVYQGTKLTLSLTASPVPCGEWSIYNTDGAPNDLNIMTAGHGYWVKMTG